MLVAVEKKARVRRDVERGVRQSVEFQIHKRFEAEIRPSDEATICCT
jgi:hypothetical protein